MTAINQTNVRSVVTSYLHHTMAALGAEADVITDPAHAGYVLRAWDPCTDMCFRADLSMHDMHAHNLERLRDRLDSFAERVELGFEQLRFCVWLMPWLMEAVEAEREARYREGVARIRSDAAAT